MRCDYCGADDSQLLVEVIAALRGCNNCRVDIKTAGKWTGNGYGILQALVAKYGEAAVVAAWEKATARGVTPGRFWGGG